MGTTLLKFAGAEARVVTCAGDSSPGRKSAMYFGYGLGGIIVLVLVVMLLTGRL
jgi:hypothetical protein